MVALLIAYSLFSCSVEQKININLHRSKGLGITGVSDTEVTDFGLGMIVPLSRCVGLTIGVLGFGVGSSSVDKPIIAGEIGFIEMIPTKYISPYLTERLRLGCFKKDEKSRVKCLLGIDIGIDFLSDFFLSPFVEGGYVLGADHFAFRYGGGFNFQF